MDIRVSEGQQVLRGARSFVGGIEVKPPLGTMTKLIAELDVTITQLSVHAVDQENSNRAFHASVISVRAKARELRREYLRPIAETGKSLFENDPMLIEALAMPEGQGKEHLVASALAIGEQAKERGERFIEAGFGPDFVEQVKQVTLELQHEMDLKAAHRGHRAAATAGALHELRKGRRLLRLLDAMVGPWLEKNMPARVAEWKSLTRFVRVKGTETPVAPVAPVTPVTPAAGTPQGPLPATPNSGEVRVA